MKINLRLTTAVYWGESGIGKGLSNKDDHNLFYWSS